MAQLVVLDLEKKGYELETHCMPCVVLEQDTIPSVQ